MYQLKYCWDGVKSHINNKPSFYTFIEVIATRIENNVPPLRKTKSKKNVSWQFHCFSFTVHLQCAQNFSPTCEVQMYVTPRSCPVPILSLAYTYAEFYVQYSGNHYRFMFLMEKKRKREKAVDENTTLTFYILCCIICRCLCPVLWNHCTCNTSFFQEKENTKERRKKKWEMWMQIKRKQFNVFTMLYNTSLSFETNNYINEI